MHGDVDTRASCPGPEARDNIIASETLGGTIHLQENPAFRVIEEAVMDS